MGWDIANRVVSTFGRFPHFVFHTFSFHSILLDIVVMTFFEFDLMKLYDFASCAVDRVLEPFTERASSGG